MKLLIDQNLSLMRCFAAALVLVYPAVAAAYADDRPTGPPRLQFAALADANTLHLTEIEIRAVEETRTGKVSAPVVEQQTITFKQNDAVVTKTIDVPVTRTEEATFTVPVPVMVTRIRAVPLRMIQAFETDGRAIAAAALSARLQKPTLTLVASDGRRVPAYYTSLFKPGTIVLVESATAAPADGEKAAPPDEDAPDVQPQLAPQPKTTPPELLFARVDSAGQISLRNLLEWEQTVFAMQLVVENGMRTEVPVTVRHRSNGSDSAILPSNAVSVFTADGKPIPPVRRAELLKQETTVLAAQDGKPVDPLWLQIVQPATIVLVPPVGSLPEFNSPRNPAPQGGAKPGGPAPP